MDKHPLQIWREFSTIEEREELAKLAGTSAPYLFEHLAVKIRIPTAIKAAAIEEATREMNERSGGRLPIIYRWELCQECASCPYAQKA